jgi:hypothetical protein
MHDARIDRPLKHVWDSNLSKTGNVKTASTENEYTSLEGYSQTLARLRNYEQEISQDGKLYKMLSRSLGKELTKEIMESLARDDNWDLKFTDRWTQKSEDSRETKMTQDQDWDKLTHKQGNCFMKKSTSKDTEYHSIGQKH